MDEFEDLEVYIDGKKVEGIVGIDYPMALPSGHPEHHLELSAGMNEKGHFEIKIKEVTNGAKDTTILGRPFPKFPIDDIYRL